VVRLHRADGTDQVLAPVMGPAFQGEPGEGFPTVVYRFAGAGAQLISANPPLAIVPLFE